MIERRLHWSGLWWITDNGKTNRWFYSGKTVLRLAEHIESLHRMLEKDRQLCDQETERANRAEAALDAIRTDLAAR